VSNRIRAVTPATEVIPAPICSAATQIASASSGSSLDGGTAVTPASDAASPGPRSPRSPKPRASRARVQVVDDHPDVLGGQPSRQHAADAVPGTGDRHLLAPQLHRHQAPPISVMP
jgi:hypothetical protein